MRCALLPALLVACSAADPVVTLDAAHPAPDGASIASASFAGALLAATPEGESTFCSAFQIGARHVVTIEHCSGTLRRDGLTSYFGRGASPTIASSAAVANVDVFPAVAGALEGVALVELARDLPGAWDQLVVRRHTDFPADPSSASAATLRTVGYGFNCDVVLDESCCDPRYEEGCVAARWGNAGAKSLVSFARVGATLWALPRSRRIPVGGR